MLSSQLLIPLFYVFTTVIALSTTPPPEIWESLNTTLRGRLQSGIPFARPCFSLGRDVLGQSNVSQCRTITAGYTDHTLRLTQFGAYMNTEWETCQSDDARCLLDSSNSANSVAFDPPNACSQGSVPSYYIDVQAAEDVQAAFRFSQSTGVDIVIKNTGHDYKGRSSAPGSLALWTHNLQSLRYEPNFIPKGCAVHSATEAVTFGAGVTHGTLYNFAEALNITLPGGSDITVGAAGGYLQGGGHSAFSNSLGLAVDRVLEFKGVVPTGAHIVANACQHSDLFFALRGGGGGTFMVVLEVTMRALPRIIVPTATVLFNGTDVNQRLFLDFLLQNSLRYAESGWGGYIVPGENLIFANPLLNMTEAALSLETLKAFVTTKLGGQFSLSLETSYLSFFNKFLASTGVPVGLPFITTSRLVPAENFATSLSRQVLLDTLIHVFDDSVLPLIFMTTPFLYQHDGLTSVTPAWRTSLWHVTASAFWNFNTSLEERISIYNNHSRSMEALRSITPTSGAYQNEADVYEPDFARTFWGNNYDRLVSIKRKYDPDHLLDCWQCVDWKGASNPRYHCYIPERLL